jgi:SEC-C motif-containing protein
VLSPSQVILARCQAFVQNDFNLIYELHHPESFFRHLYPRQEDYLAYASEVLSRDFSIRECRILKEEIAGEEARVIYYLDILFRGERLETLENCRLRRLDDKWLYLTTQKIERHDFPAAPEMIDWDDFERVEEKIIY